MSGGPTIVVKFGESVADGSFFLVALDDAKNVNVPAGQILQSYDFQGVTYFVIYYGVGDIRTLPADGVKSQFNPGDEAYFLAHFDADKLRIADIQATAGTVINQGHVTRSVTDELLFTARGEALTLSHIPAGYLESTWFGRSANLDRNGMQVTADVAPCLGNVTYDFSAMSFKYVPPPMTLSDKESYPVAIVISVEAG